MISPTKKRWRSGNFRRVWYAYSTARLDPIAEAELASEAVFGDVPLDERVVVLPEIVHDMAAVVGSLLPLDVGIEAEAFPEVGRRVA